MDPESSLPPEPVAAGPQRVCTRCMASRPLDEYKVKNKLGDRMKMCTKCRARAWEYLQGSHKRRPRMTSGSPVMRSDAGEAVDPVLDAEMTASDQEMDYDRPPRADTNSVGHNQSLTFIFSTFETAPVVKAPVEPIESIDIESEDEPEPHLPPPPTARLPAASSLSTYGSLRRLSKPKRKREKERDDGENLSDSSALTSLSELSDREHERAMQIARASYRPSTSTQIHRIKKTPTRPAPAKTASMRSPMPNSKPDRLIPPPIQQGPRWFNVRTAMGLSGDKKQYSAIRQAVRVAAKKCLPIDVPFEQQEPEAIKTVTAMVCESHPKIEEYQDHWPAAEILRMFLRHRISGLHRKGRTFGSSKRRGRQPKPGAVSDATQEPVDPNGLPAPTSYDEGMQSAGNESASDDERSDEDMEEEEEIEHPKIFLKIRLKPRPEQAVASSSAIRQDCTPSPLSDSLHLQGQLVPTQVA